MLQRAKSPRFLRNVSTALSLVIRIVKLIPLYIEEFYRKKLVRYGQRDRAEQEGEGLTEPPPPTVGIMTGAGLWISAESSWKSRAQKICDKPPPAGWPWPWTKKGKEWPAQPPPKWRNPRFPRPPLVPLPEIPAPSPPAFGGSDGNRAAPLSHFAIVD